MKPNSLEHERLSNLTPGSKAEERGVIECPHCGVESEVNRAAVVIRGEYTCPDCDETTKFDSHIGTAFLVVILVIILAPFYLLYFKIKIAIAKLGGKSE